VDGLSATKSEGVGLSVRAISFQDFNLCDPDPPTLQTDGRTDGRTTCNLNTALCNSASRGKNDVRSKEKTGEKFDIDISSPWPWP